MPLPQFLVLAVVALLVTIPAVLLIPRARTSPTFDRLLWVATVVVAFLIAWVAVAMAKNAGTWGDWAIGDTPVLPAVIGGLIGAFALNLPLWLLDRFESGKEENAPDEQSEEASLEGTSEEK
jgi:hypothetical protein